MDNYLFIPACIAVPLATAVVIWYIRNKMSGKGDDKISKKEKDKLFKGETGQVKTGESEQVKASQATSKTKFSPESKGSAEEPDGAVSMETKFTEISNVSQSKPEQYDQPPAKPKRRTKGKNSVAGELEKYSQQESGEDKKIDLEQASAYYEEPHLEAKETKLVKSIPRASKTAGKKDKQKIAASKSVDQSKYTDTTDDKIIEDRKQSLPSSLDDITENKPLKLGKKKTTAPLPRPELEATSLIAESHKIETPKAEVHKEELEKSPRLEATKQRGNYVEESKSYKTDESKSSSTKTTKLSKTDAPKPPKTEAHQQTKSNAPKQNKNEAHKETSNQTKAEPPKEVPKKSKIEAFGEAPKHTKTEAPKSTKPDKSKSLQTDYHIPGDQKSQIIQVESQLPESKLEPAPTIDVVYPETVKAKVDPDSPNPLTQAKLPKVTVESHSIKLKNGSKAHKSKNESKFPKSKEEYKLSESEETASLLDRSKTLPLISSADSEQSIINKDIVMTKPKIIKPKTESSLLENIAKVQIDNASSIIGQRKDTSTVNTGSIGVDTVTSKQKIPIQSDSSVPEIISKPLKQIIEQSSGKIDQQQHRKLYGFMEKSCQSEIRANKMDDSSINKTPKSEHTQVRVLNLNTGNNEESLYRLQEGFILQIRPGANFFGKKTNVFTNCPKNISETFDRKVYRKLEWQSDSLNLEDDTSMKVEIQIQSAGSFHYYLTLNDCTDIESAEASGYFLVDPVLTTGPDNKELPLDCIQCETFMSKCLGTLDRWPKTLKVAKKSGYNMIHFTPIQELGGSRSGYSLQNQLKLNSEFSTAEKQYDMEDVKQIVEMMDKEWNVLSITDIVLNHTANESNWLVEHPECTFNLVNSPHLRPAYILDRVIYHLALEIADDKWASRGIPKELVHEHQVQTLQNVLHDLLHKPKVEEFFLLDAASLVNIFRTKLKQRRRPSINYAASFATEEIEIIPDPLWRRYQSTVDVDLAIQQFNLSWADLNERDRLDECCNRFRSHLDYLNKNKRDEIRGHVSYAVGCILGGVRYERLQPNGPRIPKVTLQHPLVPLYFCHFGNNRSFSIEEEEERSFGPNGKYIMAHNGWVVGDNPLKNFAAPGSNVYLRRELNAWGDSVKLRYGNEPADCPYLWDLMRRYVEQTARLFHGIRLDNCHSTPIHVAEYLLDCARIIRPNLYVISELFTGSDKTDNIFVNRLGINSIIREAMSAPDSNEEGRLVYRYGGEPVGAFLLSPVRPMTKSIAHAIFLDITHDNQSPCQKRTVWDMLPSTSLVNMACCASGSTRGYDEIVPHHINVVTEERKYPSWTEDSIPQRGTVNASSGIIGPKKILNDLHYYLAINGYNQVFVDQVTEHIVTVTRHNPVTHESVILVAYTSFRPPSQISNGYIRPLIVQGEVKEILFEMKVYSNNDSDRNNKIPGIFVKDEEYINGINDFNVEIRTSLQPVDATFVKQFKTNETETTFEYTRKFTPGSVIAFKLSLMPESKIAIDKIRSLLCDFTYTNTVSVIKDCNKDLLEIVGDLSLSDLNRILYRCEQEERDEGRGWGSYNVPNYGSFVYCGLQGIISVMADVRLNNDLGHPICDNLRNGKWLIDYIIGRLKLQTSTEKIANWLEDKFHLLEKIPHYLIPAYFDAILAAVYLTIINHAWNSMSRFVSTGSEFVKALSLCSVQFCGVVKSSLLPRLSPNLMPPRPPTDVNNDNEPIETSVTISAGLPHFSVGYVRNWGRDTFIALPGNLLVTGRYDEARWIILSFAGTLRHGLIPNLLDGGLKSRFNCRDSIWFWLYSIQRYVDYAPNGHTILKDKVSRLFPSDDSEPLQPGECDMLLENVIQEALQRHFDGVHFTERNAGSVIDSQMIDKGFENQIGVDLNTGFPFGGNAYNCGTWMDKMGSSSKADNKGKPATPRDGSAVEIVGLCKAAVHFLARMHSEGKYNFNGVSRMDDQGNEIKWSYKFWDNMIKENFEKYFWINTTPVSDNEDGANLINHRGIYKDVLGATQLWADYQLRCNFPIALAVAPDMITTENGNIALSKAEEILLGPLGIKTLDPRDWAYRGDYDNSNDGTDTALAHGFNYHQGPEWLWPVGWFLRAKLAIASKTGSKEVVKQTLSEIKAILANRFIYLSSTPWRALPELTNSDGSYCRDSNPAQAWSTGCLLEVLWEMHKVGEELSINT